MAFAKYDDRVLAWVDIMNFSNFVIQQKSDAVAVRKVYLVFELLRELLRKTHGNIVDVASQRWNFHVVSDTMTVSFPYDSSEELALFSYYMACFQMLMIAYHGLFLRGAIVFGEVYDGESDIIFGPAVIKAHKLETGSADWFRIMADPSIVDMTESQHPRDLYRLEGEHHFLNYLNEVFHILAINDNAEGMIPGVTRPSDLFKIHKQQIESSVSPAVTGGNPDVLNKYKSLAQYHNHIIGIHCTAIERILERKPRLELMINAAGTSHGSDLVAADPTLTGLLLLLKNDFGVTSLSSNVHDRTAAYLQQLKADLSTYIIDTTWFYV